MFFFAQAPPPPQIVIDMRPRTCRAVIAQELQRLDNAEFFRGWVLDAAEAHLQGAPLPSSGSSELSEGTRADIRAAVAIAKSNPLCQS